jgi:glycine C-acetyltransferase
MEVHAMRPDLLNHLADEIEKLKDTGLYKDERTITSAQQAAITVSSGKTVLNFCANNYLGLSNHPRLVEKARSALSVYGFGMSSVRFICGTQDIHKTLEARISAFLGTEDTILYSSCFDANGGLFETLLDENDAVISDALNHASIIDGIRLCKANDSATATMTCSIWNNSSRRHPAAGSASSPPTGSFPWTASLPT